MDAKIEFISAQVIEYLKTHAGYDASANDASAGDGSLTVDPAITFLEKPWSIVYFMTLIERDQRHRIVVKVSRWPEQQTAEESWQDDHLIDRGVREYDSLVRIYDHFQSQGNPMLRAVRPIAFARPVNGIVMDFADGQSFYRACMTPRRILPPGGPARAGDLAFRAGEWLRTFHNLSDSMRHITVEAERHFTPALSRQLLFEAVERLQHRGADPTCWAIWRDLESALGRIESDERVWIHSDYHMGNVMVIAGDRILCMDTALDKQDHPYTDVGKFAADLQSRRARTLSYGLIPITRVADALRQRFLDGYAQGKPIQRDLLALYEGQYLFEKWDESLDALENKLAGKMPHRLRRALADRVLNPTFARIIQHRMTQDLLR